MQFSLQEKVARNGIIFVSFCFLFFLLSLSTAFAAEYTPLVGIPGLNMQGSGGLANYLNRLYVITIGIGAIIAFIKIAMAGVQWSMSDVVTNKETAKEDIKGALLGLAILLIPFIVLNTIYPNLTNLNILRNTGGLRVDLTVSGSPAPASTDPSMIASPTNVSVGQVDQNCQYTRLTDGTDMNGAPNYIGYDDTDCRSQCASHSGSTFTQLSESAGRCSWYEGTACTPGIDCAGDTGYAAP